MVCGLLVCGLIGCGGSGARAPVEDRRGGSSPPTAAYIVQPSDTLYSLAFRHGLDFRKVAAANRIPAPYTIYPGQQLLLVEAALPRKPRPAATTRVQPAGGRGAATAPDTVAPATAATATPAPATRTAPVAKTGHGSGPGAGAVVKAWRWPATGRITRGYSASVHKGIDIGGEHGDPIRAAADGTVVYAGTGIVGFGELLIVKHNDTYLSAYGHNRRLLVGEGENVRAGQTIAEKGSSGTDTVKLHFEIRRAGKPVDPTRLLPRR